MDEQEIIEFEDEIFDSETKRLAFRNVFVEHPDGPLVLAIIANECGSNEVRASNIEPVLIAFYNWMLGQIGVNHDQNFMEKTKALLTAANDNDIVAARKKLVKEKEDAKKNV